MSLNRRERQILSEMDNALRSEDPKLRRMFALLAEQRPGELPPPRDRMWATLRAASPWEAVSMTLGLQVVVAIGCDRAARAGNLWLVLLLLAVFPLALVPLIAYSRAHP